MLMINQDVSAEPSRILSKWSSLTGSNSGGDQQELIEYVKFLTGVKEKNTRGLYLLTLNLFLLLLRVTRKKW